MWFAVLTHCWVSQCLHCVHPQKPKHVHLITCRLWGSDKGMMLKWSWIPPWVLIEAYKAWLPLRDSAWCSNQVGYTWKNLLHRRSSAVGDGSGFGLISSIRQLQEQGDLSWGMKETPEGQALACMSLELCVISYCHPHTNTLCHRKI